ncbi:hypothetical protein H312_02982 [Anncaliia algerae PRA339]|uniref:Uncharacterized protein n=1 Tax=Anncaliia algerae PRA339 TaxID=1288291 RepID=A0A059EY48_9MICR|nr:hypothetical protein H312_02982 [Anncaliia algerae PRA339]
MNLVFLTLYCINAIPSQSRKSYKSIQSKLAALDKSKTSFNYNDDNSTEEYEFNKDQFLESWNELVEDFISSENIESNSFLIENKRNLVEVKNIIDDQSVQDLSNRILLFNSTNWKDISNYSSQLKNYKNKYKSYIMNLPIDDSISNDLRQKIYLISSDFLNITYNYANFIYSKIKNESLLILNCYLDRLCLSDDQMNIIQESIGNINVSFDDMIVTLNDNYDNLNNGIYSLLS